ncbi:hypothetical protein AQUCO_00900706v1 [Aquilegia coerulea]|uniref:Uncharacterized protein n=1 Tax=Aquilegia coerulea TaxID=218851 RepID=A0A2G5EF26_AQUCA|nr:hypothetical protein AQUCO_00900706v1 [Aquilegia coerulea]
MFIEIHGISFQYVKSQEHFFIVSFFDPFLSNQKLRSPCCSHQSINNNKNKHYDMQEIFDLRIMNNCN